MTHPDSAATVVIVHDDPATAAALRHAAATAGWHATLAAPGPDGLAAALAADPDVAVVGCGRLGELPATTVPVLAVGDADHSADLRAALDAGARELIAWPDDAAGLPGSLARLAGLPRPSPRPVPASTLVAVAGVQGGVGSTTIGLHLAAAWARWGPKPVLLADLAGGLGFRLDLGAGAPTWSALAPIAGGLDGPALEERLMSYWPHLSVLPLSGLADGQAEPAPDPKLVATVLQAAAGTYQVVVTDVPPRPGPAGEAVLAAADVIIAVARADSAGFRALETAYASWSDPGDGPRGRSAPRVGLAVTGTGAHAAIATRELRQRLGDRLWATVPAAGDELNAAAEDGILLLHRPKHPAITAILDLAHRVLPTAAESAGM